MMTEVKPAANQADTDDRMLLVGMSLFGLIPLGFELFSLFTFLRRSASRRRTVG